MTNEAVEGQTMSKTDELREAIDATYARYEDAIKGHRDCFQNLALVIEAARSELARQQSAQRDSSGPYGGTSSPSKQGDVADRETGRPEGRTDTAQSTGAGVDLDFPTGAIENGRTFFDRLEHHYKFECEGGSLENCGDWNELKRCFEYMADYLASQKLIGGGDSWWYEISDNTPRDRKILLAKIVPHFELSEPDHKGGLPNSKRDGRRVWWACTGSWSEKYKRWWDGIEPSGLAGPTHYMDIPPLPSPPASTVKTNKGE